MYRCIEWRFLHVLIASMIVCSLSAIVDSPFGINLIGTAVAQDDNANDNNNNNNNNNNTTPELTLTGSLPGAGVVVDAKGVLSVRTKVDRSGALDKKRRLEARGKLGAELAKTSELRKVSLTRLEAEVQKLLAQNKTPSTDMLFLAGLTKLQYVFFYPETGDIVLAGPAEGYMVDEMQRPIGIDSGKAVLQLEDLIVALRTFGPKSQFRGTVGCSIDPTQEGLARMQEFLSSFGSTAFRGDTRRIVRSLQESLGHQVVTIKGIPAGTHFANILVEADYRMKLIGIGLEEPPVKIVSYVKRANPSSVARNAMQRWYFIPDYDCVKVTDDGMAAEFTGQGVKLVNANELVRADGTRAAADTSNRASKMFVDSFTAKYAQLAAKAPVYAQLRNLIDMLIAAAYIQDQDFYTQANWSMETFGDEDRLPVEIYAAPKEVETAVNAIWKGNTLMTPVGGGVHINPREAISAGQVQLDDGSVAKQRKTVDLSKLSDGQWWWD